jgi:hypothetical protein
MVSVSKTTRSLVPHEAIAHMSAARTVFRQSIKIRYSTLACAQHVADGGKAERKTISWMHEHWR